jgi:hypothetical protein
MTENEDACRIALPLLAGGPLRRSKLTSNIAIASAGVRLAMTETLSSFPTLAADDLHPVDVLVTRDSEDDEDEEEDDRDEDEEDEDNEDEYDGYSE